MSDDQVQRLEKRLARERAARAESERMAEEATRTLFDRRRDVELLGTVATAANTADDLDTALRQILRAVCVHTGWPVGHAYLVDRGSLRPTDAWILSDPERFERFRVDSMRRLFEPGAGLPGSVLEQGAPAWVPDLARDPGFLRADVSLAVGLRSAFAFPMLVGADVVGVLEFFSAETREPDRLLLALMEQVGIQVGRVAERARARADLERSNADLEQFAYRISHDLHEPLRTISAFAGLIERRHADALEGEAAEFLAIIVAASHRMQDMISGLLQFSRAGQLELGEEPVDSRSLVDHALRALRTRIEETGARIRVDDDLPRVRASESALGEVFQNLIANALKFTREGEPPEVHVSADAAAGEWCFAVADQGIGIEPSQRERAFEVFQRLTASEDHEGTGIGLAVARRIVEGHGGRIWVEGNEPHGSVFRFALPR